MIPKRKFIVLIPFTEILEEYSPYEHFLWFYDKGLKSVIEALVANLDVAQGQPFKDLELEELMEELYGTTMTEDMQSDHLEALEQLDRCNTYSKDFEADNKVLEILSKDLVQDIESHLSTLFNHDAIWEIDPTTRLQWKGNNLILVAKHI